MGEITGVYPPVLQVKVEALVQLLFTAVERSLPMS